MTQKRATNGKKIPTAKEKAFAKEYALGNNKLNGTQSALKVYNTKSPNTANSIALANLSKPTVLNEIDRILEENNLTDDVVMKEHLKIIKQDKQLSPKVTAIGQYYTLKGYNTADKEKASTNIAFIINTGKDKE